LRGCFGRADAAVAEDFELVLVNQENRGIAKNVLAASGI